MQNDFPYNMHSYKLCRMRFGSDICDITPNSFIILENYCWKAITDGQPPFSTCLEELSFIAQKLLGYGCMVRAVDRS